MLVALHRGTGFIARAIRWQTRSGYSHASVLLEQEGIAVEAREFQGVRIVRWAEVIASGEGVDLFRVEGLTEEQEIAVREFLWDQIGKPYDYTMVARFITRRQEERESSGKWFCSELVFAAFEQAGVKLLERIEPWAVSPGMLRLSTRLEEVQSPKFKVQSWGSVEHREEKCGKLDARCCDSPLTPALSPLRGEGDGSAHVSQSPGLAHEDGKAMQGLEPDRSRGWFASPYQDREQAGRLRYGKPEACAPGEGGGL